MDGRRARRSPDDVLGFLGSDSRFLLTCIVVSGFAWTPIALTGLCPAFIVKHGHNTSFLAVVDEFNLKNESAFLADGTTTAFMVGNMIGGIFITQIGDRYGRQPVFIACLMMMAFFGLLSAMAQDVYLLCIMRFIHGIFYTAAGLVGWVLGYENTPVSLRFFTSVYFGLTWVFGTCLLALVGYLTPNWRYLMVVISLPNFVTAIVAYMLVPESLHFLVSSNKRRRVAKWLIKARKYDGDELLGDLRAEDVVGNGPKKASKGFWELICEMFEHKKFLVYTAAMVYLWIVDTFIYFGLSFYAKDLAGSFYLNFVLMSLVEAPAYVFAPIMMNRHGRRLLVCFSHVIAGMSFLGIVFFDEALHLPFWLIGKFSISCSFMSIYVYASEIFPTDARNKCIGFCETMSRIGGMLSPHLGSLAQITPSLPAITLSGISVLGGVLTFLLPETLNTQLPATISETTSRRRPLNDIEDSPF
ncbi:unnamed protein product [Caenorhabditis auriculariae]|uniref:Major facilitator superfamily (MFS) profile domain-containing protein n=1 Tax=Caenorhabditis auriculariae TaxID=2777116 RepID=A0A8S1HMV1_9PELO|nr:unnamed protein product [Caenorhabditis auriculariae]